MIAKSSPPEKHWVDKGREFAWRYWKFCKAVGKQFYSTMSDTNVEFVERTMQLLENILFRSMEDHGYKYINKLARFVATLISGKIFSIDLILKDVEKCDFFPACPASHYKNIENSSLNWRQSWYPQFWLNFQEDLHATVYTGSFWNSLNFFQKASNIRSKAWTGSGYLWYILSKK